MLKFLPNLSAPVFFIIFFTAMLIIFYLNSNYEPKTQATLNENKEVVFAGSVQHGVFTDSRDGQEYRTVKIGNQTWMAENLNYKKENFWCYDNDEANCKKYGKLYDWETAIKACPKDWHLPDTAEWKELVNAVGGNEVAGKRLKSKTGWDDKIKYNDRSGNGTDDYGFSAMPGGSGSYHSYVDEIGFRDDIGEVGGWWSATETSGAACGSNTSYGGDDFHYGGGGICTSHKGNIRSVRCILDQTQVVSSENKDGYFVEESEWRGVSCKKYSGEGGYATIQECVFPNADLQHVYSIVKKVDANLKTELPAEDFKYSPDKKTGCKLVDYQYKSKKHLLIELFYNGGVTYVEITEEEKSTRAKIIYSANF